MGKNKYIETPEKLWELFESYKAWAKSHPRYRTQFVGKDGTQVMEPLERPLTMEGFELFCFEADIISDMKDYFSNKDDRYTDYAPICQRVKQAIRNDQIEGGMVGQYNPSITQRLNGLTEKTENKNEVSGTIELTMDLNG